MKASRDGPSMAVIRAVSGTGRAMASDVVASGADALSLADVDFAGMNRVSERSPGEIRVNALVEIPSDRSAAAPGQERRKLRLAADCRACQRGRDHDGRELCGWRIARPGCDHCDRCGRACLLLFCSNWQCRYRHHDVEVGILLSRKPSCEAATSLKGLAAEGDGMPNVATCNSVGIGVPVIGASRDGIGAVIARAHQDAGANVAIAGVENVPVGECRSRSEHFWLDARGTATVAVQAARAVWTGVPVDCAAVTARGEMAG